ncbi:1500_t:CDS:2 [Funneliformis caledonium]|uniref:1500_t:CDS:1 n=1 Tax=Funneliformis caledonium TaxID=1117310 RepID=A0A9N9C6V3_9GLOM|nr:1500_t:CDS:2 [Funneliformis caledonium]
MRKLEYFVIQMKVKCIHETRITNSTRVMQLILLVELQITWLDDTSLNTYINVEFPVDSVKFCC